MNPLVFETSASTDSAIWASFKTLFVSRLRLQRYCFFSYLQTFRHFFSKKVPQLAFIRGTPCITIISYCFIHRLSKNSSSVFRPSISKGSRFSRHIRNPFSTYRIHPSSWQNSKTLISFHSPLSIYIRHFSAAKNHCVRTIIVTKRHCKLFTRAKRFGYTFFPAHDRTIPAFPGILSISPADHIRTGTASCTSSIYTAVPPPMLKRMLCLQ